VSYLGPEFGGAAADVADALATLAERDRAAFEDDEVTVEVDGEEHAVPVEKTGFSVDEVTESGEHVTPHVIEPAFGVGRVVYSVLAHSLHSDEVDGEQRQVLRLPPAVAPTTVGVFPMMDKDGMGELARDLAADLRARGIDVTYDDSGNIGRRYRRQDEVGTPYCVTVDYESLEEESVTLRERDSTDQVRVPIDDLPHLLADLRAGRLPIEPLVARVNESRDDDEPREVFVLRPAAHDFVAVYVVFDRDGVLAQTVRDTYDLGPGLAAGLEAGEFEAAKADDETGTAADDDRDDEGGFDALDRL